MIDVTKFEGHINGPFAVHGNMIRAQVGPMNRAIAECYCDEQTVQLLAAAPELLAEVLRLRERVKELEEQQQEAKCEHLNRMEQIGFLMGSLYGLKARVDDETLECIAKIIAHAAGNYKLPLPVSIELQRSEDA